MEKHPSPFQYDLLTPDIAEKEYIGQHAVILRQFACQQAASLLAGIEQINSLAPLRQFDTPSGYKMSVAMTNCGKWGWVSDKKGYCYTLTDPQTAKPWPLLPEIFSTLAIQAANQANFIDFRPDCCLINRYQQGNKLSLHQDKDEANLTAPIVSVSLGITAVFQFGGVNRQDKCQRYLLNHGDVVVWGGANRLSYHGILPIKADYHPLTGPYRYNLTFRQVY